jgi:hypothetical protein
MVTTFLTRVNCILCIHLVAADSTKHVIALIDFMRRIDEVEEVIVYHNFDCAWNFSTSSVKKELADTT